MTWLRLTARRSWENRQRLTVYGLLLTAVACIVGGLALIYLPAGLIGAGLAILGLLTFDTTRAGRLTWPR